ncbi:MAG: RDD family protein [Elusimicrobiota bacterium]
MAHHGLDEEHRLARFSERALAFSIDYALFALGYLLSLKLFFPMYALGLNPHSSLWVALWTALFIVYQGYASSEGRQSLGKSLLGLRVVDLGGHEPLGLFDGIIRSLGYLVSSILSLGFAWSALSPNAQAFHDLAVGSVVVTDRPFGRGLLVRAGALLSLSLFAGAWLWQNVYETRYNRIMTVAYSHVGLDRLTQLQSAYHRKNGRYADNLLSLATVSGDPANFLRSMAALFDTRAGIQFQTTAKGYTILARANDSRRTQVTISGS